MIDAILSTIRQAGGTISVLDGDLRLRVPKGLLSAADKAVLVEHRDEDVDLVLRRVRGRIRQRRGEADLRGGIGGLWVTGKSFGPPARQRGRSSS